MVKAFILSDTPASVCLAKREVDTSIKKDTHKHKMAAPLLLRGFPLLRLRLHQHHRLAAGLLTRRPWCAAAELTRPDENVSFSDQSAAVFGVKDLPKNPRWDNPDFRKWKDKEDEIMRDIEPITFLTKEILHSDRCTLSS